MLLRASKSICAFRQEVAPPAVSLICGGNDMAGIEMNYDALPQLIKDNLSAEQWEEAQYDILHEGVAIPETARFINIRNGQIHEYSAGDRADAPLLPVH